MKIEPNSQPIALATSSQSCHHENNHIQIVSHSLNQKPTTTTITIPITITIIANAIILMLNRYNTQL